MLASKSLLLIAEEVSFTTTLECTSGIRFLVTVRKTSPHRLHHRLTAIKVSSIRNRGPMGGLAMVAIWILVRLLFEGNNENGSLTSLHLSNDYSGLESANSSSGGDGPPT